jgi:hypothetical protein
MTVFFCIAVPSSLMARPSDLHEHLSSGDSTINVALAWACTNLSLAHCRDGATYDSLAGGRELLPGPYTVLGPLLSPSATSRSQALFSIPVLRWPDVFGVYLILAEFLPLHCGLCFFHGSFQSRGIHFSGHDVVSVWQSSILWTVPIFFWPA